MRLILPIIFLVSAFATPAIVIRHDVDDAAYLTDESNYPFLFALYRTEEGHRDCVAALIHPQWAITAAHCTRDASFLQAMSSPSPGHQVELAGSRAMVDRVVRYPDVAERRPVDLALIHLSAPVTHVRPISLYRSTDETGRVVLLPGWGGTGNGLEGLKESDGRFRVAENRVDAGLNGWLVWEFDDPRGFGGRALPLEGINGPGDSGGPALIMTPQGWTVAGISSSQRTFGRAEGLYNAEEVYVRVSDFASWIDGITASE